MGVELSSWASSVSASLDILHSVAYERPSSAGLFIQSFVSLMNSIVVYPV